MNDHISLDAVITWFFILLTFTIGWFIDLLIDSYPQTWGQPNLTVIVLCCWLLYQPSKVNLITAWLLGLLLDLSYDSLLGFHAIILLLLSYLVLTIGPHLSQSSTSYYNKSSSTRSIKATYSYIQQAIFITSLLLLYQLVLALKRVMMGQDFNTPFIIHSAFSALVIGLLAFPILMVASR